MHGTHLNWNIYLLKSTTWYPSGIWIQWVGLRPVFWISKIPLHPWVCAKQPMGSVVLLQVLLLATLPISPSHETGAQAPAAPVSGPGHEELCISTLSLGTQKPVPTAQRTLGASTIPFIVLGLWVYHECPARWHDEYRCVLVNFLSKVRNMGGRGRLLRNCLATYKASFSALTLFLIAAKNKGGSKWNSLFLEASHRTDVVGPEVVYDGSQAVHPLLKEKEVFLVNKSAELSMVLIRQPVSTLCNNNIYSSFIPFLPHSHLHFACSFFVHFLN